jgi:hypothetical protein
LVVPIPWFSICLRNEAGTNAPKRVQAIGLSGSIYETFPTDDAFSGDVALGKCVGKAVAIENMEDHFLTFDCYFAEYSEELIVFVLIFRFSA